MEPNKFDNHIKNVLEERSIKPSVNAWSKLETRLDKEEKKKKLPWFFISGIASALIGVLVMVNISNTKPNHSIVEADKPEVIDVNNAIENTSKPVIVNNSEEKNNNEKVESDKVNFTTAVTKTTKSVNSKHINKTNKIKPTNKTSYTTTIKNTTLASQTEDKAVKEHVYSPIESISEVDKLLTTALLTTTTTQTKTIDAESLLNDVEFQVEKSFRTRMFSKIKDNVADIATSFANRNK